MLGNTINSKTLLFGLQTLKCQLFVVDFLVVSFSIMHLQILQGFVVLPPGAANVAHGLAYCADPPY